MATNPSKYPIAIDMDNDEIHAAQLKQTRKGLEIKALRYNSIDLNGGPEANKEEVYTGFLKEIASDRRFSGKKVVLHMPSDYISSFPLNIQKKDEETIEEAIIKESSSYISFPLDDAVIDYPSLSVLYSDSGESYKVIMVATRRSHISNHIQMLKKAGFDVMVIDYDIKSLIRLHTYLCGATNEDEGVILCNIENNETLISIITGSSILAERHIAWGMKNLVKSIQLNLDLVDEYQKAKKLLRKYGLSHEKNSVSKTVLETGEDDIDSGIIQAMYQISMPRVEELCDEIHKVTAYLRSDMINTPISKAYFYGQANFVKDLDSFIENRLNVPTQIVNPVTGFTLSEGVKLFEDIEGSIFGLTLGLAMRNVR